MTDISPSTLQSWRNTLNDGYTGAQKPRASCLHVRDAIDAVLAPAPPVVVPPVVEPPTTQPPQVIDLAPQDLDGGIRVLSYKRIVNPSTALVGGYAIRARNMVALTILSCSITGWNYGLWFEGASLTIEDSTISATGGGDDYPARLYPAILKSLRNTYKSIDTGATDGDKAVFRLMQCPDFTSERDTFIGPRIMFGGGAANEWDAHTVCRGVVKYGKFQCAKIEIYNATDLTFESCDFTGSGLITNWKTGKSRYVNCTKDGRPLNINDFKQNDGLGGITIT